MIKITAGQPSLQRVARADLVADMKEWATVNQMQLETDLTQDEILSQTRRAGLRPLKIAGISLNRREDVRNHHIISTIAAAAE